MTIAVFLLFVLFVLGLSFYFGNKTKSASGYYAAGGQIHWGVNGIAFAGDYLSAASFLGICGMIATVGYDGFLYSIGYLAGWIVALFVVAEPMKRLGKYTFTDAVDSKYDSRGIKLAAAISTLVVSVCYLIPQMVGAGVLVEPLLGFPHAVGVILVGAVVITIVATAGMTSTTYVQFLKGGLLIIFSVILVVAVLWRGLNTEPDQGGKVPYKELQVLPATADGANVAPTDTSWTVVETREGRAEKTTFVKLEKDGKRTWWSRDDRDGAPVLRETQSVLVTPAGETLINGAPKSKESPELRQVGDLVALEGEREASTGRVSPFRFLAAMSSSETVVRGWKDTKFEDAEGNRVSLYYQSFATGNQLMRPGVKFKVQGTLLDKIDFVSLMLALFFGTAALPHILIRYYTVPSPASARKSTIVAIAAIGFFYVLTMFMGLGAMISGVLNPADNNMAAPLLARSFGDLLFAVISAIAFATVLGTVAGLIVAASGGGRPRPAGPLREPPDDGAPEGPGRQDLGLRRRRAGDRARHPVQGDERDVPGWPGLRGRRVGQPAVHPHAPVLEEDHGQGDRRFHRHGHGGVAGPDPLLARPVQAVRPGPDDGPHPVQQPRDHLHPAELHRADRGVARHAEARRGRAVRDGVGFRTGTPGTGIRQRVPVPPFWGRAAPATGRRGSRS